ncbi:TPA: hypothetical protein ACF3D2_004410, partial [Escherichia coli]
VREQSTRDLQKNQRATQGLTRLTLDEACSLLNDIQTYRNNTNPINGDSRWKKKSSLVKRQRRI